MKTTMTSRLSLIALALTRSFASATALAQTSTTDVPGHEEYALDSSSGFGP